VFTLPRAFTSGEPRRWRRIPGLVLAEIDYAAGARVEETHDHARFVLVLRGGLMTDSGTPLPRLVFLPPQHLFDGRASSSGARCLVLDMDAQWLARIQQRSASLSRPLAFHAGLILHLAHRLHTEFGRRDEVSRLAIESLALGVVAEAARGGQQQMSAQAPVWLERARAFIDRHFAETMTLAMVAALVGVHPVHLARTFRRVYHTTVAGYVRAARIEFARAQLAGTDAPLGQIAAAAGFYDQSHFCRLFKQSLGLSPAAYRIAARSFAGNNVAER